MPWYAWLLFSLQVVSVAFFFMQRPKKTEDITPERQEDKIIQLYTQIEEMLDSFEEYVGEMHTGLEEKRQELLELNRQAQVVYMQVLSEPRPAPVTVPVPEEAPAPAAPPKPVKPVKAEQSASKPANPPKETSSRLTDRDKEALGRLATKPQKVRYLMSRGLSLDEVAKELDIGRGEVILIADLDKT